jgi:predicted metal-dependent HD superfamily phosphohydrolase
VNALKNTWDKLCARHCEDVFLVDRRYSELKDAYEAKNRFYHNLEHISFMLQEAEKSKLEINDQDSFLYAIYYHDIIYDVKRQDNELKSAELALERLLELGYQQDRASFVADMIVATKTHEASAKNDINLLLDIDMAILGQPWDDYKSYTDNIRKEYKIYPKPIYKKGRRGVLNQFLKTDKIYKTAKYQQLFEVRARENISRELKML